MAIAKSTRSPQKSAPKAKLTDEQIIILFENLVRAWHRNGRVDRYFIHHIHQGNFALGKRFFESVAALSVNISFEAVCLRLNPKTKQIEVYMQQREKHQTYPGAWHVPGSIFRPTEFPADVARRLSKLEFKTAKIKKIDFVTDFFVPEQRGWFLTRVYLCTLDGTPDASGKWWPVQKLPAKTIPHHKNKIIPAAVKAFKQK